MELKRILAKDTRSATEKAIALYGPDVLIISNHQVDGRTELVVALDVQPETPQAPSPAAAARGDFRQTFLQAQQQVDAPARHASQAGSASAAAVAPQDPTESQARDMVRSREIVDLVRQEIASLRREFRVSQQASAWQSGLHLHPNLNRLVESLNQCQVPAALRTLLLDALKDQDEPTQAVAVWRAQLEHSLARPQQAMPTQGVHVLAGPSGSGKTLMVARLAAHACKLHGADKLAVISYRDHRAGAWSQVQMLGAQLGVDCFRANDEEALRLLMSELAPRGLVLVDTPGVQMTERLSEILAISPSAHFHAVVPADASGVTLRKVLVEAGVRWQSVMFSKLDEAQAPWAALQLFSDNALELSCASHGSRISDLMSAFTLPQLIDLALAPMLSAASAQSLPIQDTDRELTARAPLSNATAARNLA